MFMRILFAMPKRNTRVPGGGVRALHRGFITPAQTTSPRPPSGISPRSAARFILEHAITRFYPNKTTASIRFQWLTPCQAAARSRRTPS